LSLRFHPKEKPEGEDVAAFCGCCGAEINGKDEACRVCGTPRHGMMRADGLTPLDLGDERIEERAIAAPQKSGLPSCECR
jgi:hypothetical protein